ncbi:unnamed protein product [Arabidopsis halleri]
MTERCYEQIFNFIGRCLVLDDDIPCTKFPNNQSCCFIYSW